MPKSRMIFIPMKDESNCDISFGDITSAAHWVYYCDGKSHGQTPTIVIPSAIDMFGGETLIRKKGYRKHWLVFEHPITKITTFGNKYSFESGDPHEQVMARNMLQISVEYLATL